MHRCFSGKYTQQEMEALLHSGSEFYSYLGTNDLAEVERRIVCGAGGHSPQNARAAARYSKRVGRSLRGQVLCQ